jgi:hypothetical protein
VVADSRLVVKMPAAALNRRANPGSVDRDLREGNTGQPSVGDRCARRSVDETSFQEADITFAAARAETASSTTDSAS